MEKINTDKDTLKKFSVTMFVILPIIGVFLFLRHKDYYVWFFLAGSFLFLIGIFTVEALKPVYIPWMKLAFLLSWINTRLILLIIFYLVFTPVGLIMRAFKVDLLDRKIEKSKETYWKKKEPKEFFPGCYERQF